jgi:prepilin-type N-terminal cleavage/methylation domain-containing protein
MRNKQNGFTLLEVLIAIAILGIIMAMNSTLLQEMIAGTRQQGSLVASQFETALGLEVFRNDLGNAGYGLPEAFLTNPAGTVTPTYPVACYSEPAGHGTNPVAVAAFNDCPNPPRAVVHSDNVGSANGYLENSDYLVIRSPAVGMNKAAGKWTYINSDTTDYVHIWNDNSLDMETGDYMVIVRARATTQDTAQLVINTDSLSPPFFQATYNGSELNTNENQTPGFRPPSPPTGDRYLAYGVEDNTQPIRPFNRADYYVRRVTTGANATGTSCAPGTGTLFKAVANHGNNGFTTYPVMDCVANLQVVFRVDTNGDGIPDSTVTDISGLTAIQLKEQVKEIQIYMLAHEGTLDRAYRHNGSGTILVGPTSALGRDVDLPTLSGSNWNRYRWKTYTLFVKPRGFY